MKNLFNGLSASTFVLLSGSALAHANEASMTEEAHQAMHITDAIMPVLLMVAISLIARPFFKKMRQARLQNEESQDR